MSDYDDEELPEISVNNISVNSSQFSMPDADVLASERAEEAARDEEIRQLQQRAAADGVKADGVILLYGTDSSGSEGETALAASLNTLKVAPTRPHVVALSPGAILEVLLPQYECDNKAFLEEFLDCLKQAGRGVDMVVNSFLDSVSYLMQCDSEWSDEEIVCVCMACVSISVADSKGSCFGKIVLVQLLDNIANKQQVKTFTSVLVSSLGAIEECIWPRLVRALWGAGKGGQKAARRLGSAALRTILKAQDENTPKTLTARSLHPLVSSTWRTLSAKDQHLAVQLMGRVLERDVDIVEEEEAREQLFNTLAHAAANASDRNHPDRLKVLVSVAQLQLLFRNKR